MMKEEISVKNKGKRILYGGIGLLGIIQAVLAVLKACNVIYCSWKLVYIPFYIAVIITFILFIFALLIAGSDK